MILSDADILRQMAQGAIKVSGFEEENLQPASLDLHLGSSFKIFPLHSIDTERKVIDLNKPSKSCEFEFSGELKSFTLLPGQCALGATREKITLGNNIVAKVDGRSSIGRRFVLVHITAGFIDPGFSGQITLEICNLSPCQVKIEADTRICQIEFSKLSSDCLHPYGTRGNKYQNQSGATASGGLA